MSEQWERRRILIWGKTRPELSKTYRETVCTGGIFEDTKTFVRLYPIPLRYMEDDQVFKKYQWIEASVAKNPRDTRPESYKIRIDDLVLGETIPAATHWHERARWVLNDRTCFSSVEALEEAQRVQRISLGLIRPATIEAITIHSFDQANKDDYWRRYQEVTNQDMFAVDVTTQHPTKPLLPPDYRFRIRFRCDDSTCRGHECAVLDWELDALYFRLRQKGDAPFDAAKKVQDKLYEICSDQHDIQFYMGNLFTHPQKFTIVGFWYPQKTLQSYMEF